MLDGAEIRRVIELEQPDLIVPEIEAIHTPTLQALEREGHTVIPTARAAWLTMDREGIRSLAAEELGLPPSSYRFAGTFDEYRRSEEHTYELHALMRIYYAVFCLKQQTHLQFMINTTLYLSISHVPPPHCVTQ